MDFGNITLNNGDIVLVRSNEDLIELIDRYLSADISDGISQILAGRGNKDYLMNRIYQLTDKIQDLAIDIQNEIDND